MTGGLSSQSNRVAFVMPVWKPHPEWFPAAVTSVLAQHDCDVELIVVDDGNEPSVLEQYPMLTEVAKVVTIEHGGASAARNAGTKRVTAPWIRFVDCDDVFPPASTSTLLRLGPDQPPPTITYGATDFCSVRLRPYRRKGGRASGDVPERCMLGRFSAMLPALLIPTNVARAAGDWDESLEMLQDWEFQARCYALAPVV